MNASLVDDRTKTRPIAEPPATPLEMTNSLPAPAAPTFTPAPKFSWMVPALTVLPATVDTLESESRLNRLPTVPLLKATPVVDVALMYATEPASTVIVVASEVNLFDGDKPMLPAEFKTSRLEPVLAVPMITPPPPVAVNVAPPLAVKPLVKSRLVPVM